MIHHLSKPFMVIYNDQIWYVRRINVDDEHITYFIMNDETYEAAGQFHWANHEYCELVPRDAKPSIV